MCILVCAIVSAGEVSVGPLFFWLFESTEGALTHELIEKSAEAENSISSAAILTSLDFLSQRPDRGTRRTGKTGRDRERPGKTGKNQKMSHELIEKMVQKPKIQSARLLL